MQPHHLERSYEWTHALDRAVDSLRPMAEGVNTAPFTVTDVVEVIAADEGDYDRGEWLAVLRLKDGRFAFIKAGALTSEWGPDSWGYARVARSTEKLGEAIGTRDRRRLGIR